MQAEVKVEKGDQAEVMSALRRFHRLVESDKLRPLREKAGWSQADVARYLGVDAAQVSRWERALSKPHGVTAVALLRLLDGAD